MEAAKSSIGFITINDEVKQINNITLPAQTFASALPMLMPQTFFAEETDLGQSRICALRVNGKPLTIIANDGVNDYTPVVENYDVLFPGGFSTHPIRRPK